MKQERLSSLHGRTDEDRLRFVVRFATIDLRALRQGDWINLCEDVGAFVEHTAPFLTIQDRPTGRLVFGVINDGIPTLPAFQEKMARLQGKVREILDVVAIDMTQPDEQDPAVILREGPKFVPQVEQRLTQGFFVVEGPLEEVFVWHVLELLKNAALDAVLRCPECQTIFYRVKQQTYCSRACTNRVGQRRFRARHEAEAATTTA